MRQHFWPSHESRNSRKPVPGGRCRRRPDGRHSRQSSPAPRGRTIVIGAGKASAEMARAFEAAWDGPLEGLVVTRYGHAVPCERIEIVEAAHPVPDEAGYLAARRIMEKVSGLSHDDLVVALISGGGSALLPQPAPGMTFEDEQETNRLLLASGAPIGAMNVIRNELSAIKGGRLAALAAPARVATLVISDVPGDDPALVASGPTLPLRSTRAEARHLVALHGLKLPPAAMAVLEGDANAAPRAGDPRFAHNTVKIVASASLSLEAAAREAAQHGLVPHILSDAIEGEARDVALVHAALAREIGHPQPAVSQTGAAAVGRRDHGDAARQRPWWPQCRVPAGFRARHRGAGWHQRRWPPIPMASTARATMPAPSAMARPRRACGLPVSIRAPRLPTTMPIPPSAPSTGSSSPAPPAPM
ncbi:MAG: DUF4147 domain-containing protein [Candidatus Promineifilaceae bacterium]